MTGTLNVGIVGGGIAGLAHAWLAAEHGHNVTLFERDSRAGKASIRNFGMIWPIGQPAGEMFETAMRSRARWLQLAEAAGVWVNPCGALLLAHADDERDVLREFDDRAADEGFDCVWLDAQQVHEKTPAANPEGLRGGLFSRTELCVNPPEAIRTIPAWLEQAHGVRCEFETAIVRVDGDRVTSADGRDWSFDRLIICSGADTQTLFPDVCRDSTMRRCKLQMLRTIPQPDNWKLGPHLAGGLTLRHYPAFEVCESLSALRDRVAGETPELDRYGIHVMASQNDKGEVTLGDSHEYGDDIEPFNKSRIDDLILRELRKMIRLDDWTIGRRWSGIYAKHPTRAWFEAEPQPNVHIFTGLGGNGMTLSFGLAERFWRRLS